MKIRQLTYTALLIALLIVCSQLQLTFGLVTFTLQTLAVLLISFLLPTKLTLVATGLYLLMGLIGLPVFAGWSGGFGSLASPTFGFILSFIVAALVTSLYLNRTSRSYQHYIISAIMATLIIYLIGLIYFTFIMNVQRGQGMSLATIFSLVTLPYIPFDILKAAVAILVAKRLEKSTAFLRQM